MLRGEMSITARHHRGAEDHGALSTLSTESGAPEYGEEAREKRKEEENEKATVAGLGPTQLLTAREKIVAWIMTGRKDDNDKMTSRSGATDERGVSPRERTDTVASTAGASGSHHLLLQHSYLK